MDIWTHGVIKLNYIVLKVLILDHEILDITMTESHGMASSQSLESKDRSKILTDPGNYPCPIEELPFAHVHAAASASGLDTYVDPSTGLLVMTPSSIPLVMVEISLMVLVTTP